MSKKSFIVSMAKKHMNGWSTANSAESGLWYVALYLRDKAPYVLKFDGTYWRSSADKLMAIPMYVIKIPSPPVVELFKDE
jgi:hypothetical protein